MKNEHECLVAKALMDTQSRGSGGTRERMQSNDESRGQSSKWVPSSEPTKRRDLRVMSVNELQIDWFVRDGRGNNRF